MATHAKHARSQTSLTPEQLARADLVLRQTFEKVTALFIKTIAIQVEVQELRAEQRKATQLLVALICGKNLQDLEILAKDLIVHHGGSQDDSPTP